MMSLTCCEWWVRHQISVHHWPAQRSINPPNNSHQPCNISSPRVGALPTNIQSLAQKCGQSKNEEVRRYKLEHTPFHKPFLQIKMCDSVNGLFFDRIRSKCVLTSRKKHPVQCYPSKIGPHQARFLSDRDVISKAIGLFQQQVVISMENWPPPRFLYLYNAFKCRHPVVFVWYLILHLNHNLNLISLRMDGA